MFNWSSLLGNGYIEIHVEDPPDEFNVEDHIKVIEGQGWVCEKHQKRRVTQVSFEKAFLAMVNRNEDTFPGHYNGWVLTVRPGQPAMGGLN